MRFSKRKSKKKTVRRFNLPYDICLSLLILTAVLSYALGRYIYAFHTYSSKPLSVIADVSQYVPVITIEGVHNGNIVGSIKGDIRVFIDDELVIPDGSGAFALSASSFFTNVVDVQIPEGMHFVASIRGSKYYPVSSSQGEKIVLSNRVYFPDEASAERGGYIHW